MTIINRTPSPDPVLSAVPTARQEHRNRTQASTAAPETPSPLESSVHANIQEKSELLHTAEPAHAFELNIRTHPSPKISASPGLATPASSASSLKTAAKPIKALPHVPDDIGLIILAQAQLDPLGLLNLMNAQKADNIPPFLSRVAWDNRLWKDYSRVSLATAETNYAQAFVARWNNLSQEHRSIVARTWAEQSDSIETIEQGIAASGNFDMVLAFVREHPLQLKDLGDAWQSDRDIVLAAVCQDGRALAYAANELRSDRDIVLAAVSHDGRALAYAASKLQGDREIVMAAVRCRCGEAFKSAAAALRGDRAFIISVVSHSGWVLEYVTPELQDDYDVVMAAVGQSGIALEYASDALRDERQVVTAAVAQNGYALEDASAAMRGDYRVVMAAVGQNGSALAYATADLQADREIVITAVSQNGLALEDADATLRGDYDVVMAAVSQNGLALRFAADSLRQDRAIVMAAIEQDVWAFEYAATSLRGDRDVAMAAIGKNHRLFKFADISLHTDPNLSSLRHWLLRGRNWQDFCLSQTQGVVPVDAEP